MDKEKKLRESLSAKKLEDGKEVLESEDEALRKIADQLKISPETAKHHIARLNADDSTKTCL